MQQTDRQRLDIRLAQRLQPAAHLTPVGFGKHFTADRNPLVDLQDLGNDRSRFLDGQVEQTRSVLVADFENIAQPACGDQRRSRAATGEQRIGAACGAQPDGHLRYRLIKLQAHQVANGDQRCIFVRLQLVGLPRFNIDRQRWIEPEAPCWCIEFRYRRVTSRLPIGTEERQLVTAPETLWVALPRRVDNAQSRGAAGDGSFGDRRAE